MPNSLKCRLKKFVHKGLLSEKDLSRIYTDNDVVEELEKIKEEVEEIKGLRDNPYNNETEYSVSMTELRELFDKHISKLKEKDKLTCDRNICLKNEYSNIGCEDCVVTKGE